MKHSQLSSSLYLVNKMRRGRRLAFDYGDVRVGVAVCDPDGILATPVTTLKFKDSNSRFIQYRSLDQLMG